MHSLAIACRVAVMAEANIAAANATVQKSTADVAELKATIASADAFQA